MQKEAEKNGFVFHMDGSNSPQTYTKLLYV